MSVSMFGSHIRELYLSFESCVVKDRDRKRNGEVGTSRQRRTQRTNTTPTL